MGDDIPWRCSPPSPPSSTTYSAAFAQVTNPPIDPLREEAGDGAMEMHSGPPRPQP